MCDLPGDLPHTISGERGAKCVGQHNMNTTASAGHSGINHPSKQQLPLYTVPARCVPHKSLVAAGAACPRCPLVWAAHSHALVSRTCAAPARQLQHGSNELGLTRRTCQPLATLALAMIVSLQQVGGPTGSPALLHTHTDMPSHRAYWRCSGRTHPAPSSSTTVHGTPPAMPKPIASASYASWSQSSSHMWMHQQLLVT